MDYWAAHKALGELSGGKAHPVSCVDCHDPQSMELRVTRPGLHRRHPEARRLQRRRVRTCRASSAGARATESRPYDPNLDATRQEKRSFVCGQCHVEYFCGKGMTIFFPWAEGLKIEQMEQLYDAHPR